MLQLLVGVGVVDFEKIDLAWVLNARLSVSCSSCKSGIFSIAPVARFHGRTVIGEARTQNPRRLTTAFASRDLVCQNDNDAAVCSLSELFVTQRIGEVGR